MLADYKTLRNIFSIIESVKPQVARIMHPDNRSANRAVLSLRKPVGMQNVHRLSTMSSVWTVSSVWSVSTALSPLRALSTLRTQDTHSAKFDRALSTQGTAWPLLRQTSVGAHYATGRHTHLTIREPLNKLSPRKRGSSNWLRFLDSRLPGCVKTLSAEKNIPLRPRDQGAEELFNPLHDELVTALARVFPLTRSDREFLHSLLRGNDEIILNQRSLNIELA